MIFFDLSNPSRESEPKMRSFNKIFFSGKVSSSFNLVFFSAPKESNSGMRAVSDVAFKSAVNSAKNTPIENLVLYRNE